MAVMVTRILGLLAAVGTRGPAGEVGDLQEELGLVVAGPTPLQDRVAAVDRMLTAYELTAPGGATQDSAAVRAAMGVPV